MSSFALQLASIAKEVKLPTRSMSSFAWHRNADRLRIKAEYFKLYLKMKAGLGNLLRP